MYLGHSTGYYASGSGVVLLGYQAGYNLTGSNQLIIANTGSKHLIRGDFEAETLEITGSLDITSTLTIPGFSDVSASLAAAVAGGDDLGNHTATQDLNMGGNNITSVGNVDGVDVSTLKSDFDTLEGKTLFSSSNQVTGFVDTTGTPANNQLAIFTDSNTVEGDSNLTWNGTTLTINGTGSVDLLQVDDRLQGNGSGFQFFAFNEDTVKVKFANWYSSNDRQYGMGQLWYETWFAAIDNQAGRDNRRIGFYLEEPDAGATDTDGGTSKHPSNARFYVDITGSYVASGGLHVTDADFNVESDGNVEVNGNISVTGTVDGVDVATLKSDFDTLEGKTLFSGSSQVNADSITNFDTNVKAKLNTDNVVSQSGAFTNNEFIVAVGTNAVTSSDALAVDSDGNLGIGTPNPEVRLHMLGEAPQTTQILMEQFNDTADAPDIRVRRYRGTSASRADVQTNDYLFRLNVHGQDGGNSELYGSMQFDVDGTDQDALVWRLQTRDTTGTNATRMSIDSSGDVDIVGQLSINGFSDVSASLAAAVAGGDNLGNHTATQNLDMGGNAIINVGNVDGADVSALKNALTDVIAATSSYSTATGVEDNADVTDATNVQAAGALMDSEVTNLAQVKSFNSSDYATAAQGTKADTAIQPADTGSFSTATGVEDNADVTDTANVTAAGALMDSEVTSLSLIKGLTAAQISGAFDAASASLASDIPTNNNQLTNGAGYLTTVDISTDTNLAVGNGITLTGDTLTVTAGTGLTQNVGGLAFDADGGTLTTNNADVDHILINDGGTFKRITKGNINVGDFNNDAGYLTSSPFTAAGISGSFDSVSASLASDIPTNNNQLTNGAGYTTNTGTVTSVGGTGTVDGLTLSGTVTTSGNLTLGGTISITTSSITDFPTEVSRSAAAAGFGAGGGGGSGTVTEVTVGTGLDVTNGTTTPNVTLDLTEITLSNGLDSTATGLTLDLTEVIANDTANRLLTTDADGTLTAEALEATNGRLTFNPADAQGSFGIYHTVTDLANTTGFTGEHIDGLGSVSQTLAQVYNLNSTWAKAQANATSTSTGFLGIATTSTTSDRFLIRGYFNAVSTYFQGTFAAGAPVYLDDATAGQFTFSAPTGTGDVSRIIGHALRSFASGRDTYYQIYFNPSSEWIEL